MQNLARIKICCASAKNQCLAVMCKTMTSNGMMLNDNCHQRHTWYGRPALMWFCALIRRSCCILIQTVNGEIARAVCLVVKLTFGNMQMYQSAIYHVKTCKREVQRISVSVSVRDVDRVEVVDFTISKHRGFCFLRGFITTKIQV